MRGRHLGKGEERPFSHQALAEQQRAYLDGQRYLPSHCFWGKLISVTRARGGG